MGKRSMRSVVVGVTLALAASVMAALPGATPAAALPSGFSDQLVISSGIEQSTAVIPLPDGRVLVAERNGSVELVDPNSSPVSRTRFLDVPNVDNNGEKGLLNMVLDPDFASNQHVYIYYHSTSTDRARISRFTASGDSASASTEVIIWEDELTTSNQVISDHWGGGLSFGPDDNLYVTIGDKKDTPAEAQDLTLVAGKVLRLDPDGADLVGPWVVGQHNPHMIPADNPFVDGPGGNLDEIWALGLRNPFRAKWDLPSGRFYISEVGGNVQTGANASHEDLHMVTLADAGANFGWPDCEGPDCDGPPPPDYSPPVFSIQHPDSRAMMLGPVYRGSSFPTTYFGAVFLFDFVEGWLRYIFVDAAGQLDPGVPVGGHVFAGNTELDKPLDIAEGINGELWYVGSGELHRIVSNSTNLPPVVTEATASPLQSPSAPADVQFNATASDPEGDPISYLWDFGDGNTSTEEDPLHTYATGGTFSAVLQVSDGSGTTVAPELTIEVGSPPTVTIEEPADGTTFRAGDVITARATGTDDGPFSASDFTWTVGFFHDNHVHPTLTDAPGTPCLPAGSSCVTFEIPSDGHDFSGNTNFDFQVTLTDADGISRSDNITIVPDKVNVTFDTDAGPGASLRVDQLPFDTPFVLDTLIGFEHTVQATDPMTAGGHLFQFDSWSTGQTTPTIDIVVPPNDQTYLAQYTDLGPLPRVTAGLEVLYLFEEGSGSTVGDSSGTGSPVDLVIGDPAAVTWGAGSLTLDGATVVSSVAPASGVNNAIAASGEITIEAWVTPADTTQTGPARIVSLSTSSTRRNATLGQGDSGSGATGEFYSTRFRTTSTSKNGTPSVRTTTGTATTALTHVVYTRDNTGTVTTYINGTADTTTTIDGNTTNWDPDYHLHLANEADQSRPWLGTLDLIAIYNRALTPTEITQNHDAGPDAGGGPPPVGGPPVAADDDLATDEDTPLGGVDVLADNGNGPDTDPDNDPLAVTAVQGSAGNVGAPTATTAGATVTVTSTGQASYDPGTVFDSLDDGETAIDTFTYTIGDGTGNFDTATVTITITGITDPPVGGPPVAADDDLATDEDTPLGGVDVLADNGNGPDTDPDNDPLAVTAVNGAAINVGIPTATAGGGLITITSTGQASYDPAAGFDDLAPGQTAIDTATYTIGDGTGNFDTATVTITITGINDAPTINPVTDPTVTEDTTTNIPVTATDPDNTTLTLTLAPGHPTFINLTDNTNGTGTLTITPTAGDAGTYPITIQATDNATPPAATTQPLTVTITQPSARVTAGLEVLYLFEEGSGSTVGDSSGTGSPVDLVIGDPAAVTWGAGSLTLDGATVVSSVAPASGVNNAIAASGEITIEAWVTPADTTQTGPARIVSLSTSSTRRNATLGQGDSGSGATGEFYSTRFRTTSTSKNGTPSVRTTTGTATTALTHVVYTRDNTGTVTTYINGTADTTTTIDGNTTNWDPDYHLHLANEADQSRPWARHPRPHRHLQPSPHPHRNHPEPRRRTRRRWRATPGRWAPGGCR